ncbi:hypothetical protein [Labrys neptuniae]
MPRFPDYRSEIGLNPGSTPQVRTGAEQIGQGLQSLGQGLNEAATGLAAAYQAKIARENAFDDQVKFNLRSQQRQAELTEAARTMPPGATGFATGILQSTQKGDSTMLDAISPANRPAFAGRLADDREALLDQAATLEQQGRSRYEDSELDSAFATYEQAVAQNPAMRPAAQQAYFDLVDKAGSQSAAAKAERRQAGGLGLALADWRTSFKDDPQAGAQALGLGRDGAPADPRFASIPPAQRQGLVNEALAQQSGRQALARGALEAALQNTTTALTTIGRHDGPLPDEARFIAAYGREEGARRYADFQRTVNLGADIDTIKAMTPEKQDSWLAGFAPNGDGSSTGSDAAGARDRYAQAQQAIALNRAIRRKDPNAYVRSLHPEIDQLWNDAGTSPERLKTAILATNAAMDRLGMPAEGRALLPKGIIDKALAAFGDRSKPLPERIAPFRTLVTAPGDPAQQATLFAQAMQAGLPRLAAPALAAFGRGDNASGTRLLAAALDGPAEAAAPTSPLALRGSGPDTGRATVSSRPGRADTAIDLSPAMTTELARLRAAGTSGLDPLSATLYDRLVADNLRINGGDPADAHNRATADMWRPGSTQYAQLRNSATATDAPAIGTGQDNGGARIQGPAVNQPTKPPFEMPEGPGQPANQNGGTQVPTSPGATVDNNGKAIIEGPGTEVAKPANGNGPGAPAPKPAPPIPDKPAALPPIGLPTWISKGLRMGFGRGSYNPELAASNGVNTPQNPSGTYPNNSPVPVTYSLFSDGGVSVAPTVSDFIRQKVDALPQRDDARQDSLNRRVEFGTFNTALANARRDLWTDQHNGVYRQYYTDGDYDFSFTRGPDENSEAAVVAVRLTERKPAWYSGWFFHDNGDPAGPWHGTPAPETEPKPATEPAPGATPLGTPGLSGTSQPQPGMAPLGTPGTPASPQAPGTPPAPQPAQGQTPPPTASGQDKPPDSGETPPAEGTPGEPGTPGQDSGVDPAVPNTNAGNDNLEKNKTETNNPTNTDDSPEQSGTTAPSNSTRRSQSGRTRFGVKRKNAQQWRELRDFWDATGYGNILSNENRKKIAGGRTPTVDDAWINEFPEDAGLRGEKITMHHVGGSPLVIPLPKTRHRDAHMPGGFRYNPGGPGSWWPPY